MILWHDPLSLLALLLVPALAAFLWWARRRRARALDAFVAASLLPAVAPDVDPQRRRVRSVLRVAAVALLAVALGGPMWGFQWEKVRREGIDLVIALDTSRSMLTTDVKPNRLARAKLAVRDLATEARGDRLALVPFAGSAFVQCPLTLDRGAFLESLDAVEVGLIPRGGTNLNAAIEAGLNAFEGRQAANQALVLITDGESHEGDVAAAITQAKDRGVKVFTVGIGTPEGELVPGEGGGFFKDRKGQAVKSRLDESTLQQIAVDTGGVYLHAAGTSLGLTELYRDHIASLDRRELESTLERRFEHRFQVPLAAALLLLAIEPLLAERQAGARVRRRRSWRRLGRLRGPVTAILLAVWSIGWFDAGAPGRAGNRLYDQGKYAEAGEQYNRGLVDAPDDPALHFNLGDAAYRQQQWDAAQAAFEKVPLDGTDAARTARTSYNLGNTKYRQGQAIEGREPQKTLGLWTEALVAYRRALGADPDDRDAKYNYELVEKRLAALRKKLEEQQQQQDQQQDGQQNEQQQQQNGEQQQDQEKQKQEKDEQQQGEQQQQPSQDQQDQAQQQGQPQQDDQQPGEPQPDAQQQAGQDQQRGEQGQDEQAGREPPSPEGGEQQAQQGDQQAAGQAAAAGERKDGDMTQQEAAALLDAERGEEVSPEEIVRRQQRAGVAEPSQDW